MVRVENLKLGRFREIIAICIKAMQEKQYWFSRTLVMLLQNTSNFIWKESCANHVVFLQMSMHRYERLNNNTACKSIKHLSLEELP